PAETPVSELKRTTAETRADYYLYVPSRYDADRSWPMVVTLQGTYGFDSARRQVKEWRGLAERHGFLVLAPAMKSTQGILPVSHSARLRDLARDERRVLDAMRHVKSSYNIDASAVMITGFSAGGYPLYYIALRHPELFSVLVARTCSTDLKVLKSLSVTDKAKAMPMLIFFSKTGVSPVYSKWNPVAQQSWDTFRWLYEKGCTKARVKAVSGGHHRKAQRAFDFWRQHQPQLQRKPERR
ncbi:MAG: prolyl oligopeptidase family serine peptidase, partial [Planctomycetota bacterium]